MLRLINKFIFFFNSLAALALLLSYLLPYVSPKVFPLLSVLSLAVPVLIVINVMFLMYWVVLFKKKVILSLVVLILGVSHVSSLYRLSGKSSDKSEGAISFMSYNVHSFNRFEWIDSGTISQDISGLVRDQDPDFFCVQEYYNAPNTDFTQYPYKYEKYNNDNGEIALVVFSKYKLINQGTLNFKRTANNVIYVDAIVKSDTIRVYNVHLQSHKLNSQIKNIDEKEVSDRLLKSIQVSFKEQQVQTEKLLEHMDTSPYKNIVMGDFNNTAYSYVYNKIKSKNLLDSFKEAGTGFGKTFKFKFFPARIDFILVPDEFEVVDFKNFDIEFSDHYPIYSRIKK